MNQNQFLIFVKCEPQSKGLIWGEGEHPPWHPALTASSCQHPLCWPPPSCTPSELMKLRGRILSAQTPHVQKTYSILVQGKEKKVRSLECALIKKRGR